MSAISHPACNGERPFQQEQGERGAENGGGVAGGGREAETDQWRVFLCSHRLTQIYSKVCFRKQTSSSFLLCPAPSALLPISACPLSSLPQLILFT